MNDEHRVDVGGQHLDVGGLPWVAPRDGALALEHGFDERGIEVVAGRQYRHPVADGGQLRGTAGRLQETGGGPRVHDTV